MFYEIKVTQMAAYFLLKNNANMAYIKLLKLLYLAERKAFSKWGDSMSGDRFVSMPHGPVLSQTYDLIQGSASKTSPWNDYIQGEINYQVSLNPLISLDDLDELSKAETDILNNVFDEFGNMKKFELVNYTHDNCPEWEDPNGSSYPIKVESILRAVGKNEEQIKQLIMKYDDQQQLDNIKALLR